MRSPTPEVTVLEREVRDRIAVVRLAHGKVNALDLELNRAITAAFHELAGDGDVDAVVLTATGTAFSAGVDLRRAADGGADYARRFVPALVAAFEAVFRFAKPVVAAANGHAIAGGCILVSACDRRLMAAGSGRIGVTELAVGVAFPTAALEIVRFAAGPAVTNQLVLTAATHDPEDAVELGLIDAVVPADELLDAAVEEARRLAAIPLRSFTHTKQQLRREAFAAIDAHAASEDVVATSVWSSDETAAQMTAFLERVRGA